MHNIEFRSERSYLPEATVPNLIVILSYITSNIYAILNQVEEKNILLSIYSNKRNYSNGLF